MDLRIDQRETEGIVILDLRGPLILGIAVASLRDAIAKLIAEQKVRLVLNLKNITRLDSSGLGTLVASALTLRRAGGSLSLLNMNPVQINLLILTKLTTVFELFNDEQDAVNSHIPGRAVRPFDVLAFVRAQNPAR